MFVPLIEGILCRKCESIDVLGMISPITVEEVEILVQVRICTVFDLKSSSFQYFHHLEKKVTFSSWCAIESIDMNIGACQIKYDDLGGLRKIEFKHS